MNTNPSLIRDHLTRIYSQIDDASIVIFELNAGTKNQPRQTSYSIEEMDMAIDHLANQPDDVNSYVAVAAYDTAAFAEHGRNAAATKYFFHLWLDADINSGVHASNEYPETLEQILFLISQAGLPAPSQIIASGGGYYPFWNLTAPFDVSSDLDRTRFDRLAKAWHNRASKAWKTGGFKLDNVSDLARVLRVPGTLNRKGDTPKLVDYHQPDNGVRWSIDELESFVSDELSNTNVTNVRVSNKCTSLQSLLASVRFNAESAGERDEAKDILAAFEACDFLGSCNENAENLPEPIWKNLADVMAHMKGGDRYFHELSKSDPRYSHGESQQKLDRARQFGPKLCTTIATDHAGCAGCLFQKAGNIRTPVQLTHSQPGLARLQKRYTQDAKTGLFAEIATGRTLSPEAFDRLFSKLLVPKALASQAFKHSTTSVVVSEMDYLPGNDSTILVDGDGEAAQLVLNTYFSDGVSANSGDPSLWVGHLEYLFPDPRVRDWTVSYLAHLVQRPGEKIRSALLLQSSQGVGKTSLINAMSKMLGARNVRQVNGSILGERWQSEMGNCQLLNLDELDLKELKSAYNSMKRIATEERFIVEKKGIDAFEMRTPRGMVITSNHSHPISIEKDDRRIFVAMIDAAKLEDSYYRRLNEEGMSDSSIGAFRGYLEQYDISGFNPNAEPPMTQAKLQLISSSRSHLEQLILEMREDGDSPFNRDVYFAQEVAERLTEKMRRIITVQAVTRILEKLGDVKRERKLPIGNGSARAIWIWRNHEHWFAASNDEVRNELYASNGAKPVHLLRPATQLTFSSNLL